MKRKALKVSRISFESQVIRSAVIMKTEYYKFEIQTLFKNNSAFSILNEILKNMLVIIRPL